MIPIVIAAACAPSAPPPAPTEPAALEPLPWTFDAPAEPGEVDLDALGIALERAAREVLDYDARDVVDPYLAHLAASADPGCPDVTVDPDGNRYWLSGCQSKDGTSWAGFLFHSPVIEVNDGAFVFSGDTLNGNARVAEPQGRALDIQGAAGFLTGTSVDGATDVVVSTVRGGFALDDAATGWLADGPQSVDIELVGLSFVAVPGALVQATGSVVTDTPDGTWAVTFDANAVATGPLSDCEEEPGGTVVARDPAGRWIEIDFDGPVVDVTAGDADACDGCGRATLDGAELGAVCADFTAWTTWEVLP